MHQELIEILYHTLWETVHVFFEHRELGHDVGQAGFLYPFLGQEKQGTADAMSEVANSIRMKVADDAKLREQVAREESEQIGNAACSHLRPRSARRKTDHLRQWRFGDRRERLGDRLRVAARRLSSGSCRLAFARARQHQRHRQRRGHGCHFPAPIDRAGAPGRRRRRDLHEWRLAQHHHGSRRGSQTQHAHRRVARLRWRRNPAARPGRFPHRGSFATTFRAFRKCRPRSIT